LTAKGNGGDCVIDVDAFLQILLSYLTYFKFPEPRFCKRVLRIRLDKHPNKPTFHTFPIVGYHRKIIAVNAHRYFMSYHLHGEAISFSFTIDDFGIHPVQDRGSRNGRAKSDGSEPVEFEWAVVARLVQALGLIDFAAFSRLTV
jgi:hypothetical protein